MDINKNIIICSFLIIIFILQFLIFLKLETYNIDNFANVSTLNNYESYSSIGVTSETNPSPMNPKMFLWMYMVMQARLYSILLIKESDNKLKEKENVNGGGAIGLISDNKLKENDIDDGVIGLIICLSFEMNESDYKVRPILKQMSLKNKVLTPIESLQSSFSAEQITIIKESNLKVFEFINEYTLATTDAKASMITDLVIFDTLKENLKLTNVQLQYIKSIIELWKSNKNSDFTIENFDKVSKTNNDYKPWQDFFKACKI